MPSTFHQLRKAYHEAYHVSRITKGNWLLLTIISAISYTVVVMRQELLLLLYKNTSHLLETLLLGVCGVITFTPEAAATTFLCVITHFLVKSSW